MATVSWFFYIMHQENEEELELNEAYKLLVILVMLI